MFDARPHFPRLAAFAHFRGPHASSHNSPSHEQVAMLVAHVAEHEFPTRRVVQKMFTFGSGITYVVVVAAAAGWVGSRETNPEWWAERVEPLKQGCGKAATFDYLLLEGCFSRVVSGGLFLESCLDPHVGAKNHNIWTPELPTWRGGAKILTFGPPNYLRGKVWTTTPRGVVGWAFRVGAWAPRG